MSRTDSCTNASQTPSWAQRSRHSQRPSFQVLAKPSWQSQERCLDGVVERGAFETERPEALLGIELRRTGERPVRFGYAPQHCEGQSPHLVSFRESLVERDRFIGEAKCFVGLSLLEVLEAEL